MRLRSQPQVVIGPVPARLVPEIHGEIESAFAGKFASRQADPMPAEGKWGGWIVFDSLPSIKPEMKTEWRVHIDQKISTGRQDVEGRVDAPVPGARFRFAPHVHLHT